MATKIHNGGTENEIFGHFIEKNTKNYGQKYHFYIDIGQQENEYHSCDAGRIYTSNTDQPQLSLDVYIRPTQLRG